ncbi:hypothetical protein ACIRP7_44850 [Streptomyces sp. NPDC102270]|uniref:hypothetical protein n=1 Tax=Streptomyces sp. NPDC102270 TaxID=3366150 RepID=UPI0037F65AD0
MVLRSRRGTEMAASFPEIVAGAVQLPDLSAFDGELVVWDAAGRLAFERLQNRLARRGAGAAQDWPAPTSSRSRSCGCPGRTRPDGPTGGAEPPWNPCSPHAGSSRRGCCVRRPPTRTPCASGSRGPRPGSSA